MDNSKSSYLVIDDDAGDIALLRRIMDMAFDGNVDLEAFTDPEMALSDLGSKEYDLIFVDYLLGGLTGLEVFKAIREKGCDTPVVFLTGQGSEQIAVEAMKAGVVDYIVKGELCINTLQRVVDNALAKYELEREVKEKQLELESLARTDELTGLYNRRHIMEYFYDQVALAERYDIPLSLIVIDLDNFKLINDTYGHLAGDYVLIELAKILQKLLRKSDRAGRYGGDEFCVILPHTAMDKGKIAAERIRRRIDENVITGPDGELIHITCSIGVAQLPVNGRNPEELFACADLALYEAKNTERNTVVLASMEKKS